MDEKKYGKNLSEALNKVDWDRFVPFEFNRDNIDRALRSCVRFATCKTLREMSFEELIADGKPRTIPNLLEAMKDESKAEAAREAILRMGRKGLSWLYGGLTHHDDAVTRNALMLIGAQGKDALHFVYDIVGLMHSHQQTNDTALDALGKILDGCRSGDDVSIFEASVERMRAAYEHRGFDGEKRLKERIAEKKHERIVNLIDMCSTPAELAAARVVVGRAVKHMSEDNALALKEKLAAKIAEMGGTVQNPDADLRRIEEVIDMCRTLGDIAQAEKIVEKAMAYYPKSGAPLREKLAAKKAEVESRMGGTVSPGTVKAPEKKETPKKPGPLKRKR